MPDPKAPQFEQYSPQQKRIVDLINNFDRELDAPEIFDFGTRGKLSFNDVIRKFSVGELKSYFQTRVPRNEIFEAIVLKRRYQFDIGETKIIDGEGNNEYDLIFREILENLLQAKVGMSQEKILEDLDNELSQLRIHLKQQYRLKI